MPKDVYKLVAEKLDKMPNGFPSTDSGVELKILKKIFPDPKDAERWLKFNLLPEPVEIIAERFSKSKLEMQIIIDDMVAKGLVVPVKSANKYDYCVLPFFNGLWETMRTSEKLTDEFAELWEEYFPHFAKTYGTTKPPQNRVIPVNAKISSENIVYTYEDVRKIIEAGKSFKVMPCMCRIERKQIGKQCPKEHSVNVCISISTEEGDFIKYPEQDSKVITKSEALEIMKKAEEEGLIHQSNNVKKGHDFICNCCSCCCALLRGAMELDAPYFMLRSDYLAKIDQTTCTSCGICAEERCQLNAIIKEDEEYKVIDERCIGCGICTTDCPTESIRLVLRPKSDRSAPAEDIDDWYNKKAASRGIEIPIK